ncbi:MAG: hypothetical protein O3B86_00590 [Planctomycetota bacterium]|nr:hypothetical protein [Planctomycetota bacterium]
MKPVLNNDTADRLRPLPRAWLQAIDVVPSYALGFAATDLKPFILVLVLLVLSLAAAKGEEQRLQRWAVIATGEVVASGLPDLLTVELSQNESLELVEREQLQAAMSELQLSTLVRADQVGSRLQLGRTLKANALMVLSFERTDGKRLLRVVVCDADLGIRLWEGRFACRGKDDIEQLVQHCATTVDEVRQRFAGGIQHIIAVPAFLSEDFEHHFDYLQTRCSDQLSSSLMAHAGVAVVEIEEARAIRLEFENTLSGALDRPISSVVKATYRVDVSDKGSQRRVNLKIELTHGDGQREQIEKTLDVDAVGSWLVQDLTNRLITTSKRHSPALSPKVQREILTRHAQRFAELGQWEQSISLRETALVLDPNDVLQRALLITEYQHRFQPDLDKNWHSARFAKPIPPETRERAMRIAAHDYSVGLDHLAWLIRNQLINRVDAIGILGRHVWYKPPYMITAANPVDSLKLQTLQPAIVAQRKFLRDVYPLVMKLPDGRRLPRHLSEPFYGAQYVVTNHVISDVGFNGFSSESLVSLRELLTRHLAADARTSSSLLGLIGYTYVPGPEDDSYSDWIDLLTDLSKSDRDLARLYGVYGLAQDQNKRTRSTPDMEHLLTEVQRMGRTDEPIYNVINLRMGRPKPQPVREPAAPLPRGFTGPLGRMHLEPLRFVVDGKENVHKQPRIIGMLRCGDVDAYWSKDRFFVMHDPDVLRELKLTNLSAEHTLFWEVAWDGKFIWLHAYGQGIVAVRPDGTGLTSFKRKTPGYSKGHRLIGLSPGRALMAGSFGETNRAWCGLLEIGENGKSSVNVFFEAKNVVEGRPSAQAAADVTTVFQPEDLSRVHHSDGRDFVLVDRHELSLMLIDLETLDVSVPEKSIRLRGLSTETELGYLGRLFVRDGLAVPVNSGVAVSRNSKRILYHDGWLYRPGYVWMRQHVATRKLERLQAKDVPHEYWDLRVGSSAHYGLITYSPFSEQQQVSRLTILNESPGRERKE